MRLNRRALEPKDVGLQMTSMIDIVFLLIIFFLCTAVMGRMQSEEDITLPAARSGGADGGEGRLVVNVRRDGEVRVMGAAYGREALAVLVAGEAARRTGPDGRPALVVKIRADADAPYRCVQEVMTVCRQARVERVSFGLCPQDAPALPAPR